MRPSATIWKYPLRDPVALPNATHQVLSMPGPERILAVQEQGGQICLWAVVRPGEPTLAVNVVMVGTGGEIVPAREMGGQDTYRGTVQLGPLVVHVFAVVG